jgi:AcrR family transcriptional regulator
VQTPEKTDERSPKGRAKKRWKKPSADAILVSAARTFAKQGYGGTSLRDLISGAGVSTTAFYARFASKEDVLRALVARLLADLESQARVELSRAQGLEDGFVRGAGVLYRVLLPQRNVVRILLTEGAASPDVKDTMGALYAGLAGFLAARLEELKKRGAVAEVDASAFAWAVVGALQMQVQRWAVYEQIGDRTLRAELDAVARSFLAGLRKTKRGA